MPYREYEEKTVYFHSKDWEIMVINGIFHGKTVGFKIVNVENRENQKENGS